MTDADSTRNTARSDPAFWHPAVVRAARAGAWTGGFLILIAAGLIAADILLRALVRTLTVESFELGAYCFAIAFAVSLPHSFLVGAHIRINVTSSIPRRRIRQVADVLAFASLASFACCLGWYGLATLRESVTYKAVSNSTLALPLAVPQAFWAAGFIAFAAISCVAVLRGTAWLLAGRDVDIEAAATVREEDAGREPGSPV